MYSYNSMTLHNVYLRHNIYFIYITLVLNWYLMNNDIIFNADFVN